MKPIHYFLILGIVLVPIFAYIDVIAFSKMNFLNYFLTCLFEYCIFLIGMFIGVITSENEKRKT
jgi:hypothetical protein